VGGGVGIGDVGGAAASVALHDVWFREFTRKRSPGCRDEESGPATRDCAEGKREWQDNYLTMNYESNC
jgi:hypothetical protein